MADLTDIQAAQSVKVIGSDSTGLETNPVNADSNGNLLVKDYADGTPGSAVPTVATQVAGSDGTNLRTLASDTSGNLKTVGNTASASSDSGNPIKTGGVFNTTLPSVTNGQRVDTQADSNGRQIVTNAPLDGSKTTYSASITDLTAALLPTDIFTITGSASKTIRILRVMLSGTEQNSASRDILLIKRSAANSGGTSTNPTSVPHDSNDAAATATINAYTANPTSLGAAVGTVRSVKLQLLATNVSGALDKIEWNFGNRPGQGIVLRGTSQVLAINLNGVTSVTSSFSIDIEWTEE